MEYDGLSENKKESDYLRENIKILLEDIYKVETKTDPFDPEIFKRVIEKGIVYKKWQVMFQFKCGAAFEVSARRKPLRSKKENLS